MAPTPFEQMTEADFDTMVDVNLKGTCFAIQRALPLLSANASVVVTTSIANLRMGLPDFSVYAATKAALRSMVQALSLALITRGIRVNAICPGAIDTPALQTLNLPPEVLRAIQAEIAGRAPRKRFGTPEEVAQLALFLASDESSYVVGEEIVVDGGLSLVDLASTPAQKN